MMALDARHIKVCRGFDITDRMRAEQAMRESEARLRFLLESTQAIPWVADAATKIHAARLVAYDAAKKVDQGRDARMEVSMAKVFATEMAWEIVDHAMQTFGAMGMAKEMPLQLMASKVRLMRIYDGPSEVHRWVIARRLLGLH